MTRHLELRLDGEFIQRWEAGERVHEMKIPYPREEPPPDRVRKVEVIRCVDGKETLVLREFCNGRGLAMGERTLRPELLLWHFRADVPIVA